MDSEDYCRCLNVCCILIESENHRMVQVGRDLKDNPPPWVGLPTTGSGFPFFFWAEGDVQLHVQLLPPLLETRGR